MLTSVLHDANIFAAAMEIAASPTAGNVARIQALRVLYFQLERGRADPYESFLTDDGATDVPPADYPYTVGIPLPDDAAAQVRSVAMSIVSGGAGNQELCSAARRVARAAQRAMRN